MPLGFDWLRFVDLEISAPFLVRKISLFPSPSPAGPVSLCPILSTIAIHRCDSTVLLGCSNGQGEQRSPAHQRLWAPNQERHFALSRKHFDSVPLIPRCWKRCFVLKRHYHQVCLAQCRLNSRLIVVALSLAHSWGRDGGSSNGNHGLAFSVW